jgi:hypothetical protein
MNINIDRILRDPRQDLFVYDNSSKKWYCREGTDYFCPEPSIEFYTKLVLLDLLATLRECENPEKKVLDGADRIDYNRFVNTICERFNIPWKDTSPSLPKGIISQPTV